VIRQLANVSFCLLVAAFLALAALNYFFLNDSPSQPIGIYRYTHEPLKVGTLVRLADPMKMIAAMPGDHVRFAPEGIYREGKLIPQTAPEPGMTRVCPYGSYVVPPDMFLPIGRHPDSFDGRYVCFLPLSLVASTAEPVFTK
jgi:type IV secretory pathway protease TraF